MNIKFDKILGMLREQDSCASSNGGVEINHVEYYTNLPNASEHNCEYYFVDKDTLWSKLNPLAKTQGGLYRSDGTNWLAGVVPELAGISDGTNILIDYPVKFSGVTVDNTAKTVTINSQTDNNFTDSLKLAYDSAVTNEHTHSNKTILDNITASFTTTEKTKLAGIAENANNYILPSDVVHDSNYVHTDNNVTTDYKNKLDSYTNYSSSLSFDNQISVSISNATTFVGVSNSGIILRYGSGGFTWSNGVGTCMVAGDYFVNIITTVACATAAQALAISLFKNSAAYSNISLDISWFPIASGSLTMSICGIVNCAVNDTIQLATTNYTATNPVLLGPGNIYVRKLD